MTTTSPPPLPVRRRMPLWAKVLLWFAAALLALVAAGFLWVVAALSGGFDDLLDVRKPAADDRRVVEAREQSEQRLAVALEAITGAPPSASGSECTEGQHNWKIDDPYDLLCTQSTGGAVRVGAIGAGVDSALLRLHDRLIADGWVPEGVDRGLEDRSSLARMVEEYGATSFPAASYRRDGVDLVVEPAHRGSLPPYSWPGVVPQVPDGELAVLVLLREEYFSG